MYSIIVKTVTKESFAYKTATPPEVDMTQGLITIFNNETGCLRFNIDNVVSYSVRPITDDGKKEAQESIFDGSIMGVNIDDIFGKDETHEKELEPA